MNKALVLAVAMIISGTAAAQSWSYQRQPSIGQQYIDRMNQQRQTRALENLSRDFSTFQQQHQMDRMLNRSRSISPYSTQGYRPYQFNY